MADVRPFSAATKNFFFRVNTRSDEGRFKVTNSRRARDLDRLKVNEVEDPPFQNRRKKPRRDRSSGQTKVLTEDREMTLLGNDEHVSAHQQSRGGHQRRYLEKG